jgi:hypothetical protein
VAREVCPQRGCRVEHLLCGGNGRRGVRPRDDDCEGRIDIAAAGCFCAQRGDNGRLCSRPTAPLAGLVTELADERQRLDLLDVGSDGGTAVRSVFSWSYRHLVAMTVPIGIWDLAHIS